MAYLTYPSVYLYGGGATGGSSSPVMPVITSLLGAGKTIAEFTLYGRPAGYTGYVAKVRRISNANVTTANETLDIGLDSINNYDYTTSEAFRAGADLVLEGLWYGATYMPVVKVGTGQLWMWKLGVGRITDGYTLDQTTGALIMDNTKGSQGYCQISDGTATNFAYLEQSSCTYSRADGLEFHVRHQSMKRKTGLMPACTYVQSVMAVTVTNTAHGIKAGQKITAYKTTGNLINGTYTVASVTDANNYIYTALDSQSTSGNCTIDYTGLSATNGAETLVSYGKTNGNNGMFCQVGGNTPDYSRFLAFAADTGVGTESIQVSDSNLGDVKQYSPRVMTMALETTDSTNYTFGVYEGGKLVANAKYTLTAPAVTAVGNLTGVSLRVGYVYATSLGNGTISANSVMSGVIVTKTLTATERSSIHARWMTYVQAHAPVTKAQLEAKMLDYVIFDNATNTKTFAKSASVATFNQTALNGVPPEYNYNYVEPVSGLKGTYLGLTASRAVRSNFWTSNFTPPAYMAQGTIAVVAWTKAGMADLVSFAGFTSENLSTYIVDGSGNSDQFNAGVTTHHLTVCGMTAAHSSKDVNGVTSLTGLSDANAAGSLQAVTKYLQPSHATGWSLPVPAGATQTIPNDQDPANYNNDWVVTTGDSFTPAYLKLHMGRESYIPEGRINPASNLSNPMTDRIPMLIVFSWNNNAFDPNASLSARDLLYRKGTTRLWGMPLIGGAVGNVDGGYGDRIGFANVAQWDSNAKLAMGNYLHNLNGIASGVFLYDKELNQNEVQELATFAPMHFFGF